MPSAETTRSLIEDWRPECLILVGIAGGIVRASASGLEVEGPSPGDVLLIDYVHYGDYAKRVDRMRQLRYFAMVQPSTDYIQRYAKTLAHHTWWDDLPVSRPESEQSDVPRFHQGELVALEYLAGDGFSEEQSDVLEYFDHALGVDMESGGVARAMHRASESVHYRPVWLGLRGISDRTAANRETQELLDTSNNEERSTWRDYAAAVAARYARLTVERMLRVPRPPHDAEQGAPEWTRPDGGPLSDVGGNI